MAQTIQLRRGTAAQWVAANPILASGEVGIELVTGKFKIGDGTTTWNLLPYATDVPLLYYFRLNQTVPQTISGGMPVFSGGLSVGSPGLLVGGSVSLPYIAKTADYTAGSADYTIAVTCSGANITILLPTAIGIAGRIYNVKKMDTTAYTVIIDGSGGQTIDGDATQILSYQYDSAQIQSTGANWIMI